MAVPYPLAGQIRAWLLHTLVRLGDTGSAEQALAGLGEHDRDLWEMRIAAAVLRLAQILDLLAGNRPAPRPAGPRPPLEPLSNAEIRVLRYLPTYLSAPEIAGELSVSTSTVKTHLRNLYAKLGAHSRAGAVESARALGLLAPSARPPAPA